MSNRHAWHTMDTEQICEILETNAVKGLSRKQAAARAKKLNIRQPEALHPLFIPSGRPLYKDLGRLMLNPITLLTLFVALITCFFEKQYALGGIMIAILLINTLLCAIANTQARNVWKKLQLYSNPMIKVVRSGKLYTTDARNVLPGDLVILSEGDVCPADIKLEKGSRLRVSQYVLMPDLNQKFDFVSVEKSGDFVYPPNGEVFHPDCCNIVYAGSVIQEGFARGIAVETGSHTYIGASNCTVPGTNHAQEPQSISFIKRYFTRFATVQAIVLVPLTVLLTVTMRQSMTFAESFLTALALCASAIAEHLVSLAGIVHAAGINSAASQQKNAAVAIIKSNEASDKLCEMTDLLLLDSSAISDGKYHLESVYACGNIYNTQELRNTNVERLATDLYLYRTATRPIDSSHRDAFDAGLTAPIDALIKHVITDTEAIELIRTESYVSCEDNVFTVHNKLNSGEYVVMLSQDEQLLLRCTHVATPQGQKLLDDSEHIALRTLCRIYRESGYRILLIATQKDQSVVCIGVLAFSHKPGFQFSECCRQLIDGGVRISVFMPDTAENLKILMDSALIRDQSTDVLTAQAAVAQGLDLHVAYGSYRAYLGFSETQIKDLIVKLKERGNCVASYCVSNSLHELHSMADLTITCDAIEYRSTKVAESYYDKMPVDGRDFSARASQHMRRSSGVVLRRAGDQGGGLHGILTGRTHALAINCNLANAVTYLITVQFFRAVLLIVPAMFGMQMLSAVSLLIGGLILDAAAIMLFAWAKPADSAVSTSYSIMRRLEKPITYNVANVVSACVSALLVWLSFAFLQILGIVDLSQSMGMGFVSTYLLQGTVFAVTLHEYTSKGRKTPPWPLIISAGLFVLLLGVCMLVPTFAALTGCNHHSFLSVAITFIAPLIYYFTYRILTLRGLNLHK